LARRLSHDILGLFGARVIWTVLGLVTGVILARKLGPENRGILQLALVLPSTAVTFVKLGVSQANVYFINRERVSSEELTSNSIVLALTLGLLVAGLVWAGQSTLLSTVLKGLEPWALALTLVRVPLILLDEYLYGVLQAIGQFKVYTTRMVVSEILRLVLTVLALIVFHLGLFAAVVMLAFVSVFNIGWLLIAMRRQIAYSLRLDVALLRKQLSFGAKSYVQTLNNHLLLRADNYLISDFLGPSQLAFYSLGSRFTEMLLEIPQAVGTVLYPRLASSSDHEIHLLTAQACRRTLLLTGLCSIPLLIFGPFVITLWYGQDFAPAGRPLPWLCAGALAFSVFVILSRDFTSRNQQRVNIAAGIPALVSNVGLNLFMIPAFGITGAAMATMISYSAACIILLIFYLPSANVSLADVLIPKREDFQYFWGLARRGMTRRKPGRGMASAGAGE